MTWALLAIPTALFVAGLPIYIVLLAGAATALLLFMSVPPIALHQVMFGGVDNYALLAVPFFIFAGDLMARSGIAERLTHWVLAMVGHLRGSLGLATVGTATLLGAVSGSSPATVAALGQTLYPDLKRAGYGERFSLGLVTSSGSIAIIVPPSIAMILYGATAEQSIPRLFLAGIIPGLLLALVMAVYILWWAQRRQLQTSPRPEGERLAGASGDAAAALFMPVLVLGGIYLGLFSPTEAGGFACLYVLLVARFLFRSLSWGEILESATHSAYLTAQVLIIVASASVFSWVLSVQGVPQATLGWIADLDLTPVGFLLVINAFLLLLGCVLDPTSAILVLTPILMPIIQHLGIDPIHFGIIMTVNLSLGMFTPPFGLNIFVSQSVLGAQLADIYRGILPFFCVQLVALGAITFVPQLSLLLARTL
ncbi:TRAP transporter large permease [Pelagibius litoralis]|uniref:TRAP transporter large permease protein n=1 Tax=Pelagibius litoralis TaxID=374515 RepID=A0A967KCM2_9PROT|nr:TRAP transporter large permease [Pelagibius litoralis]NIA69750.1 TRAP transporter large permease [Pelagibius litoralis]